ncbi:MAG: bifunctional phosphoribosylaminoimidazolecarboxamide formyltransferase/IMP cyclohydrolase [Candidatus Dormibacteraeota bacterium]|nr:bifunctional phosphoribosylaminoimidazolecarboxamide formyltransferase/IMP cyclohydrolase [Candidatus Dormibacteraeota bacterium]MBV9524934.1 bifunctional phosphoribosylaminoimidazolecarboxamide formyltransferase/IMP cyclohydrolase [Candidatus Dormibacteraeota bacterium]
MTLRALIGVSDKAGLVDFARALQECGVELVATDGTRRALSDAGIEARAVSELTGFPEMLDGRVKTLHPAVHAGILARRAEAEHMRQLEEHGFVPFDIVVVSLYPFAATRASGADDATVVENIDIGGPTMIRAAAKNSDSVAVVVSPTQYEDVVTELRSTGAVSAGLRAQLAADAFSHVAAYDTDVADYMRARAAAGGMPREMTVGGALLHELRYGENPHQRGALYAVAGPPGGVAHAQLLQGTALSFTNWLDVDAARRLVSEFDEPAACVIKHTNPCGFAVGDSALDAYRRAFACDPRSAFGGIVGLNRPVDAATAAELTRTFLEAVVSPGIEESAVDTVSAKQRMRMLVAERPSCSDQPDVRSIDGGILVQTPDRVSTDRASMTVATQKEPDGEQWRDLLIAWRVCRHVKSNAVVIVNRGSAVGVGAGQMSRVEAAELAVARAGPEAAGAVAASDAFFPMPDGLETLGRAGVRAVIHPGGSKKDAEVVAAAEALGMVVVHAGERHFRH